MNTPEEETPVLTEKPQRFIGFDVARCLAFFGMVVVNYKVVMQGTNATSPAWLNDFLGLFSGRAAATFVVLAGVGLALLYKAKKNQASTPLSRGDIAKSFFRHGGLLLFLLSSLVIIDQHIKASAASGTVETPGMTSPGSNEVLFDNIEQAFLNLGETATSSFLFWGTLIVSALVLLLFLSGKHGNRAEAIVFRRVLFLAALGYVWYPLWTGDILHFYAGYFFIGLLLLRGRAWLLACIALTLLVTTVFARFQWPFFEGWSLESLEYHNIFTATGAARNLFYNGWHPIAPWMCFFIVGMLIAKTPFKKRTTMVGMIALGAVLSYVGYQGEHWYGDWRQDRFVTAFHTESAGIENAKTKKPNRKVVIEDSIDQEKHKDLIQSAKKMNTIMRFDDTRPVAVKAAFHIRDHGKDGPRVHMSLFEKKKDGLTPKDFNEFLDYVIQWIAFNDALPSAVRWPTNIFPIAIEQRFATQSDFDTVWLDPESVRQHNVMTSMGSVSSLPPGPLYVLSATGIALLVIGSCLLISSFAWTHKLLTPLVRTGQMALTLYVAHIIVGFGIAEELGKLQGEDLKFIAFFIVLAQVLSVSFACWWRSFFKRGPLEALMRVITG